MGGTLVETELNYVESKPITIWLVVYKKKFLSNLFLILALKLKLKFVTTNYGFSIKSVLSTCRNRCWRIKPVERYSQGISLLWCFLIFSVMAWLSISFDAISGDSLKFAAKIVLQTQNKKQKNNFCHATLLILFH